MMHRVSQALEERKGTNSSGRSSTDPNFAESNLETGPEVASDFITTKHSHETDENGNHIVIGREGDVRRCEDEVRVS